jgi:hypothetical protein
MVSANDFLDELHTPRPELIDALIQHESGGNNNAVSNKGARGLAQVMPATARDPGYGVKPLSSGKPEEQRRFATDYLGAMLKKYGGNEKLALAAYNAGPGAVDAHGDIPPFPETQNYVKKILSSLNPISDANASEVPYQAKKQSAAEFLDAEDVPTQKKQSASDFLGDEGIPKKEPYINQVAGAIAAAPILAGLGIKQRLGGELTPADLEKKRYYEDQVKQSPIAGLVGNVGMMAPTAFIPGANTIAGAGVVGGLQGLIQPTDKGESALKNTAIGAAGGAGGAKILNSLGGALASRLWKQSAAAKIANDQNAQTIEALKGGRDLGMKIPGSAVNNSPLNKLLESIGGKDAVRQDVQIANQKSSNIAIPEDLGLPAGTPISTDTLDAIRAYEGRHYRAIAELKRPNTLSNGYGEGNKLEPHQTINYRADNRPTSFVNQEMQPTNLVKATPINNGQTYADLKGAPTQLVEAPNNGQSYINTPTNGTSKNITRSINGAPNTPAQDLEALKRAREDAQGYHESAKMPQTSGGLSRSELLQKARESDALAAHLEDKLTAAAEAAGKPELMANLKNARETIAKTRTIQDALNKGNGEISLADIGARLDVEKPLTGNMKTLAKFQQTFSPYVREASLVPTPGVSKIAPLAAATLGMGGHEAGGAVGGFLAGGLPLIGEPVRKLILSGAYQKWAANVPIQSASKSLKSMTRLINSQGIKGMTPALSGKLANMILNDHKKQD